MYTKFLFAKTTLKNNISLFSFLIVANMTIMAQIEDTVTPVFEIVKVQDGTENGDDVIYKVKLTDENGRPLINTSNEDLIVAIEFGVDSDVERNDIETVFPTSVAVKKGTGSTIISLKVLNDRIHETPESLVAMIYKPTLGKVSETRSYAQATITDNDNAPVSTDNTAFKETDTPAKAVNSDVNPTITMLNK